MVGAISSRLLSRHRAAVAMLAAAALAVACGGSGSGSDGEPAADGAPAAAAGPDVPPAVTPVTQPVGAAAQPAPVAVTVQEVTAQLTAPWSLAFLPDGSMLVTEKAGSLRRVSAAGEVSAPLGGVPPVYAAGQGGLLDVVAGPGFATDQTIFFTFAEDAGNGESRAAVAKALLGPDAISNVTVIHRQTPARPGSIHYGSRLVFDRDGYLFVTFGERNEPDRAQDLTTTQGKVVRILPDGTVPAGNPELGPSVAAPGIWSYGHRNPQGAALNPRTGELWISEHGPRGGDEINRIVKGANFGWPRITHGRDYVTEQPFGEGTAAPGVEAPLHYWVPVSVAPAGLAFYTGDKLPGWQGSLLVATLAGKMLARLTLDGNAVIGETRHLASLGERFRDVRQGPDGYPYLLTDSGRLLRIVPQ